MARAAKGDGGRRRWLRARRSTDEPRSYRVANSIRLPWAAGVASFLLIALFAGLIVGRNTEQATDVPPVVLDYQEAMTVEIAQSIRKGVNEGINDIEVLAGSLGIALDSGAALDAPQVDDLLRGFGGVHGRYQAIAVLDRAGRMLAALDDPALDVRVRELPIDEPGIDDAVATEDGAIVIAITAPVPGTDLTVWAEYDAGFLRFALASASPGDSWVLNSDGRVIADQNGSANLTELTRRTLRNGVTKATAGASGVDVVGGSLENLEIVGYSPVSGVGPTGDLGWSVVTARSVISLPTPGTTVRRQAVLFSLQLVIMTITIFGWLWIVVIRPIIDVQKEAERVAFGDLTKPVKVERYDEIGLLGRALERTRVLLIRRRGMVPRKPDEVVRTRASDQGLGASGGPENRRDGNDRGQRRATDVEGERNTGTAADRRGPNPNVTSPDATSPDSTSSPDPGGGG